MSAPFGFGPGDIDCTSVLDELTIYLDAETDEATRSRIRVHLEACTPCLEEYGLAREVKALIGRCCGGDQAPATLRSRISVRITEIHLEA